MPGVETIVAGGHVPHLQMVRFASGEESALFPGDLIPTSFNLRPAWNTAYDLDPANPATCVLIAQTWVAEGRYSVAEVWFTEAVALQPGELAYRKILARFYLDHNITLEGRSVAVAEELLALDSGDAEAYDLAGWAAFQNGDYATARDYLERAIDLDPTLASAYYHLGVLLDVQGIDGHQEAFERAIDLDTTGEIVPLVERAMGKTP